MDVARPSIEGKVVGVLCTGFLYDFLDDVKPVGQKVDILNVMMQFNELAFLARGSS